MHVDVRATAVRDRLDRVPRPYVILHAVMLQHVARDAFSPAPRAEAVRVGVGAVGASGAGTSAGGEAGLRLVPIAFETPRKTPEGHGRA